VKATIYKSTGSWYTAKTETGERWQCRVAGKMKIDEQITSTNPVAVGDQVILEPEEAGEQTAVITEILPRTNYIVRASPRHRYRKHIVAANLDQAVLIVTLREPRTSQGFVDRFLVSAAAYHVAALLVVNKSDLHRAKEREQFARWQAMYGLMHYPILLASALQGEGLDAVREALAGRRSLLAGHSGVGKSTLINDLIPGQDLRTQQVSEASGKGLHTTTFAEMFSLPSGGQVIDTPGLRELGIVEMEKSELSHYFLDMRPYLADCRFNNCLHVNEPGCGVKRAVADGHINVARYESYLSMLETLGSPGW